MDSKSLERQVQELSAEEFQQKLHSWFKDQGLLTDLRSYLRRQMIVLLQNTNLGQSLSQTVPKTMLPKVQATNLLVADFLLHQQNHYTLSIFITEIPSLQTFPEFSETSELQNRKRKSRLKIEDAVDILDTIGLSQRTNEGEDILTLYQNNNEALLTCIIRRLSDLASPKRFDRESDIDLEPLSEKKQSHFLTELHNVLVKAKIKGHVFFNLKEHIFSLYENEIDQIKAEEETKYKETMKERETEFVIKLVEKDKEIQKKISENEVKLKETKKKYQRDLKIKQKHLEKLAEQLRVQFERVKNASEQIQKRSEDLDSKENRLKEIYVQKSQEMSELKSELKLRHQMLCVKESSILKLKKDLERSQKTAQEAASTNEIASLNEQIATLKRELDEAKLRAELKTASDKQCQTADDSDDLRSIRENLDLVRQENAELRTRLDTLTRSYDALHRETQSRTAAQRSNASEPASAARNRSPRRRVRSDNRRLGGGEESNARLPERTVTYVGRHVDHARERQRRLNNRLLHDSSSSDSSPTDDVLRDSRVRLNRLQRESEAFDRSYREFRKRHPQGLFAGSNTYGNATTTSGSTERRFAFGPSPTALSEFRRVDDVVRHFREIGSRDMHNFGSSRFKFSSANPATSDLHLATGKVSQRVRNAPVVEKERLNIAATLEHVINKLESAQTDRRDSRASSTRDIDRIEMSDEVEGQINSGLVEERAQLIAENDTKNNIEASFFDKNETTNEPVSNNLLELSAIPEKSKIDIEIPNVKTSSKDQSVVFPEKTEDEQLVQISEQVVSGTTDVNPENKAINSNEENLDSFKIPNLEFDTAETVSPFILEKEANTDVRTSFVTDQTNADTDVDLVNKATAQTVDNRLVTELQIEKRTRITETPTCSADNLMELSVPSVNKTFSEKIEKLKSSLLDIDNIERKFNETVSTPFFMREYNLTSIENELYNINSHKAFELTETNLVESETLSDQLDLDTSIPSSVPRLDDDGFETVYNVKDFAEKKIDILGDKPSTSGTAKSVMVDDERSDAFLELTGVVKKPSLIDLSISSIEFLSEHLSAGYDESNDEDDFWK